MNIQEALNYINTLDINSLPFKDGLTSIMYKKKNGIGEYSIVFAFKEKKPLSELKEAEIVPKQIFINNEAVLTDVIQRDVAVPVDSYCHSISLGIAPTSYNQERCRPLSGGSESHPLWNNFVATLGILVTDKQDRQVVALSNAHVYGRNIMHAARPPNTSNSQNNLVTPKVSGFQPTYWYQTTRSNDYIGTSKRTLVVGDKNWWASSGLGNPSINDTSADAAILSLNDYSLINSSSNNIIGFNVKGPYKFASEQEYISLNDVTSPNYGAPIFKSGRTTGPVGNPGNSYSCSVSSVGVGIVVVGINSSFNAQYYNVLEIEGENGVISVDGGDSGSAAFALLSANSPLSAWKCVGLIYAGTNPASVSGYITPIFNIVNYLDVEPWDGSIPALSSTTTSLISSIPFEVYGYDVPFGNTDLIGRPKYPWNTSAYITLSGRKFTMVGRP